MRVQKLSKKRVLGSICAQGHEYKKTGKSVRYRGCRTCCTCNALSVLDRKAELEEYRKAHKGKMSKYQVQYRKDKKRKNEKKYQGNYYLTVTKPKRKRDRHNKKLLRGMNYP